MADVQVPEQNWYHLKKAANCFVPMFLEQNPHITNTELHAAGPKTAKGFSVQLIGKVMTLVAIKHDKAEQCVEAYVAYQPAHPPLKPAPDPTHHMIVAALFAIPNLKSLMDDAGLDVAALSKKAKVSCSAITYLLESGRAPGGVVYALQVALGASTLAGFCSSAVGKGTANTSVHGTPFSLDDLRLPLPVPNPSRWP
jgi:hypothetical protein